MKSQRDYQVIKSDKIIELKAMKFIVEKTLLDYE